MTFPSASRPGSFPSEPARDPIEADGAADDAAPPAEAVTLADLIADAGPLPADAALECVQRLAERLTRTPGVSCDGLGPSDVLIDDDGGVWLREWPPQPFPAERDGQPPAGIDRIGRLLAFLATADQRYLSDGAAVDAAELPPSLSSVTNRLFSRNGACYSSYADLAGDLSRLRDAASTDETSEPVRPPATAAGLPRVGSTNAADALDTTVPDDARDESTGEAGVLPSESIATEPVSTASEPPRPPAVEPAGPGWFVVLLVVALFAAAIAAYAVWGCAARGSPSRSRIRQSASDPR